MVEGKIWQLPSRFLPPAYLRRAGMQSAACGVRANCWCSLSNCDCLRELLEGVSPNILRKSGDISEIAGSGVEQRPACFSWRRSHEFGHPIIAKRSPPPPQMLSCEAVTIERIRCADRPGHDLSPAAKRASLGVLRPWPPIGHGNCGRLVLIVALIAAAIVLVIPGGWVYGLEIGDPLGHLTARRFQPKIFFSET